MPTQPYAMPTPFISGLELARRFYWEAVRPILDADFPSLPHAAALIGSGSEVLGLDTEMSTDHHWGPRVMLFLTEEDYPRLGETLFETFRWKLPHTFLGYPTNFAQPLPQDPGTRLLKQTGSGPIDHRVETFTIAGYIRDYLAFELENEPSAADWLSFPQQKLRSLTGGAVFHDAIGLDSARQRFATYPHDVWLYQMAAVWTRIGQEEHLMGRAGHAGDEMGSALIAARLVRDVMNLCFLQERQYAPYAKWFGTAFMRLAAGAVLQPILQAIVAAESWQARGEHLAHAYEFVAGRHNELGITPPVPARCAPFWGRPFPVIGGGRIAEALLAAIADPTIRDIAGGATIGGIDLVSDNTDVLENTPRQTVLRLFS